MNTLFADTYFFIALTNSKDLGHNKAKTFTLRSDILIVTTYWIIIELMNALSNQNSRTVAYQTYLAILTDLFFKFIPHSDNLFQRGVSKFAARPDKNWSLTDCTSFVVMEDFGLTEALTADHHFEQAGFVALLK